MPERSGNNSTIEKSQRRADGEQQQGIEQRDADRVARAAYHRYEARGRQDGHDLEDWLEAEQEVASSPTSESTMRGDDVRGQ